MKKIVNLLIEIAKEKGDIEDYEFVEIPITTKKQMEIEEALNKEVK